MSEKQLENLYTFMDDSLGEHESRFVLKSLDHDARLRARWRRFHHCRTVLHEPCPVDASSLAQRISVLLDDEPLPVSQQGRQAARWLKPMAGMAVAASVVLGAFAWLQLSQPHSALPTGSQTEIVDSAPPIDPIGPTSSALFRPATAATSAAWEPKLQNYLMRHSQVSGSSQARNLMPYVHVISTPPTTGGDQALEPVNENLLPVKSEPNSPRP